MRKLYVASISGKALLLRHLALGMLLLLVATSQAWAQRTFTSQASGDWGTAATWTISGTGTGTGNLPTANDHVVIQVGHTVTTGNANWATLNLTINGILSHQNNNANVTVNGNYINNGSHIATQNNAIVTLQGTGAQIGGTGSTSVAGGFIVSNSRQVNTGTNLTIEPAITLTSGITITNNGRIVTPGLNASATANWVNGQNATLVLTGSTAVLTNISLTTSAANNTVEWAGSGTTAIPIVQPANGSYANLVLSGTAPKSISVPTTVAGNFTITDGTLQRGTNSITIQGDWTQNGGTVEGTAPVIFSGTNIQTIRTTLPVVTFPSLTVNKTGGVINLAGNVQINNNFNFEAGLINTQQSLLTLGVSTAQPGTLVYTPAGNGRIQGRFQRWITTGLTQPILFPLGTANNIRSASLSAATITQPGPLTAQFIPSTPGNGGYPLTDGAVTLTNSFQEGYWSFTGEASINPYTITLRADGFSTFPFDDASATTRIVSRELGAQNWTVQGTHGTLVQNPQTVSRAGVSGINREFALATTINCIAPATSAIQGPVAGICRGSNEFYSVSNTQGSTYNWTVTGGNIESGQGSNAISVIWNEAGTGTVQVVETNTCAPGAPVTVNVEVLALPPSPIVGTNSPVVTDGATRLETYTVNNRSGHTFQWEITDVQGLSNPVIVSGQGTNSVQVNWGNVPGSATLTVRAISTACGPTSVSNPTSLNVNVYGVFETANTGGWGTGTTWVGGVVPPLDASVRILHAVTGTGNIARRVTNLVIEAGGSVEISTQGQAEFQVTSDLKVNKASSTAIAISGGPIQLTGQGSIIDVVGQINSPINITGNKTIIARSAITAVSTTTLSAATTVTNNGTYTSMGNMVGTGSSVWINAAGSSLRIEGSLFASGGTFNGEAANNTVTYAGLAGQVVQPFTYFNLSLLNAPAANTAKTLSSTGVISIRGTFTPGTLAHTVTGSTVRFEGAANQQIPVMVTPTATVNYNNLQVANGTKVLAGNTGISGSLAFDANSPAVIQAGSFYLLFVNTGSNLVQNAGPGRYVEGEVRRSIPTGTSTRTFPVGRNGAYLPASITFTNVTTAGQVRVIANNGDHPNIGTSCLDRNRSVNRYWTIGALSATGTAVTSLGGTFSPNLGFNAIAADAQMNPANSQIHRFASNTWTAFATTAGTAIGGVSFTRQASGINNYGDFQVAEAATGNPTVTIEANQALPVCQGTAITFTANPVLGGPTPTYQWVLNGNNVGTNSSTYTLSTPTNNDQVLVRMTSSASSCAPAGVVATSNTITVQVSLPSLGGQVAGGTTLCQPGSVLLTLSEQRGNVVRWEYAAGTSGNSWQPIAHTEPTLNTPEVNQTSRFRAVVQNGNCAEAFSEAVTIFFLNPGVIGRDQQICEGEAPVITNDQPASGVTSVTYQWQMTTTPNPTEDDWMAAPGNSSQVSYIPSLIGEDTWYRRRATAPTGCHAYTNIVYVQVLPQLLAGTISGNQTTCFNTTPNQTLGSVTPASGGDGNISYQWQSSPNTSNPVFTDIPGATGLTYTITEPLTEDRLYIRRAISASCNPQVTNQVLVRVVPEGSWTGRVNNSWHEPGNWCGGVPTDQSNVDIRALSGDNVPYPVITQAAAAFNLTIDPNASVTMSNGGTLTLTGNFTNNGTFRAGSNTVIFSGPQTQTQVVGGSEPIIFGNLVLGTTAFPSLGIVLARPITVNGLITFNSGKITLNNNNLTLGTSASFAFAGAGQNNYIVLEQSGRLIRQITPAYVNQPILFPVGGADANEYTPFEITLRSASVSTGSSLSLGLVDAAHPNLNTGRPEGQTNMAHYITRYWDVTPTGIGGNLLYDVSLRYTDADVVGNEELLNIGKYNGQWIEDLNTERNLATNTLVSRGFFNFSQFTAGNGFPNAAPLPIVLKYFRAVATSERVELVWETASEINNHYFSIERSGNGVDFVEISRLDGAGNSTSAITYKAVDNNPLAGRSYYRLKQTDFDGKFSYSPVENVFFNGGQKISLTVYPNPNRDRVINYRIDGLAGMKGQLTVQDMFGRIVYSVNTEVEGHTHASQFRLSNSLAPGVYFVNLSTAQGTQRQKLIIE